MTTMEIVISVGTLLATVAFIGVLMLLADVPRLIRHLGRRLRRSTPRLPPAP